MNRLTRKGIPLYLQVSEALERRIDEGEFRAGEKLPGDYALSEEYGVSIITARAAMRVLIDKMKVVRQAGKGTFVRMDQHPPVWGLGSMFDLALIGLQTRLVLLGRGLRTPPAWTAQRFNQSSKSKLYLVETARESQGERFSISDVYYRPTIGRAMADVDFDDPSSQNKLMISIVQKQTGIRAEEIYQTITAEIANRADAKKLDVRPGEPLLVLDRDYYDAAGDIIQAARTKYRVDHYRYRIKIGRASCRERV